MEPMIERERGRYPRALYRCTVSLQDGSKPIEITCNTKNISTGGACLVLPKSLEIGREVNIQLHLEDGLSPVKCCAIVKWTQAYHTNTPPQPAALCEIGFQYADLSQADLSRIERIITRS